MYNDLNVKCLCLCICARNYSLLSPAFLCRVRPEVHQYPVLVCRNSGNQYPLLLVQPGVSVPLGGGGGGGGGGGEPLCSDG